MEADLAEDKDRCRERWLITCTEYSGSFISLTYSQFLSLFNSTSWLPAATGLLPQQSAAIIGLRSKAGGGEYCPGHIAGSSDRRVRLLFSGVFLLKQFNARGQMYSNRFQSTKLSSLRNFDDIDIYNTIIFYK